MYNLKENPIGIYEKGIPDKFEWTDKIKIAKSAGYDFIEMSVDESELRLARLDWSQEQRKQISTLLKKNDFYINSMCLSGHRKYPFGSKEERRRIKAYEIMDKAIILAKDLGINNIQLAGYDVYYEDHDEETEKLFIEGLKYAAKRASSASVMLSIEIMDTAFIGTITRCLKYIEIINSPWLKIYPDLGNLSRWTEDPKGELEKGMGHIVAIHLKDTLPNTFKCVPFGEGTVDFKGLFDKLKTLNFVGPFLVEMWADNTQDNSIKESIHQIRAARVWLEKRAGDRFNA
jgi:L-ribulose-5-phosphate 3-epimerase/hexulose-6-phosphate isomerase